MARRVETGCRDCKKCTNSAVANMGRNTGRATAALLTVGLSEVGMAFTKNCRGCGHKLSLHIGKTAVPVEVQPQVIVVHQPAQQVQQPQIQQAQPTPPMVAGPPPGWYRDASGVERWYDGAQWTGFTKQ